MQTTDISSDRLSPWWRHGVIIAMIFGFSVLIWLALRTYQDAPPIPAQVLSPSGQAIFTGDGVGMCPPTLSRAANPILMQKRCPPRLTQR
jgi:hypothetical protein